MSFCPVGHHFSSRQASLSFMFRFPNETCIVHLFSLSVAYTLLLIQSQSDVFFSHSGKWHHLQVFPAGDRGRGVQPQRHQRSPPPRRPTEVQNGRRYIFSEHISLTNLLPLSVLLPLPHLFAPYLASSTILPYCSMLLIHSSLWPALMPFIFLIFQFHILLSCRGIYSGQPENFPPL